MLDYGFTPSIGIVPILLGGPPPAGAHPALRALRSFVLNDSLRLRVPTFPTPPNVLGAVATGLQACR
ncbi:MAG: hypothetical protein WCR51_12260, partial [Planctomycetia bacterium]